MQYGLLRVSVRFAKQTILPTPNTIRSKLPGTAGSAILFSLVSLTPTPRAWITGLTSAMLCPILMTRACCGDHPSSTPAISRLSTIFTNFHSSAVNPDLLARFWADGKSAALRNFKPGCLAALSRRTLTTLASAKMLTGDAEAMASFGSLTAIPKLLGHLGRAANGSLLLILTDRRSSPRRHPAHSIRSAIVT